MPEESNNGSGLVRGSPFPNRSSFIVDIPGQGIRARAHNCLLKGATAALHIRVSYRNGSVRTLHLGACPHLTRNPHRFRRSLCCLARTFLELNFKLLTAGAPTIFTTVHVSMMYLATPATLTTTQNPHCSLLLVFMMYVATLRLDHLLLRLSQRVLAAP